MRAGGARTHLTLTLYEAEGPDTHGRGPYRYGPRPSHTARRRLQRRATPSARAAAATAAVTAGATRSSKGDGIT